MAELIDAIDKLRRLGLARDRSVDAEPREVTLTDDEAAAVLAAIYGNAKAGTSDAVLEQAAKVMQEAAGRIQDVTFGDFALALAGAGLLRKP